MTAHLLAIVVPAFKGRFLAAALGSVAAQTDQRFALYVCDDGSPEDLGAVYRDVFATAGEDRSFIRFDENWGSQSLVRQWNRCVAQTRGEPWIWLFSDDDIADARCVEQFRRALDRGELTGNVCRFNTAIMDGEGAVVEITPPHPQLESAEHFAYHRLRLQRRSFAPEYIFRRAAFDDRGGFVDFPFALGSDDASWITFAGDEPIFTLSGARVFWRWSGGNTSSLNGKNRAAKVLALAEFSQWIQTRFGPRSPDLGDSAPPSQLRMDRIARDWFFQSTRQLPVGFGYLTATRVAWMLHRRNFVGIGEGLVRFWLGVFRGQVNGLAGWLKRVFSGAKNPG
jgi:glycosyltransferase involved in cell wall biosynthesis